jgi:hypothetical protein
VTGERLHSVRVSGNVPERKRALFQPLRNVVYPSPAASLAARFLCSACSFPVNNQSTDLPNSWLIARSKTAPRQPFNTPTTPDRCGAGSPPQSLPCRVPSWRDTCADSDFRKTDFLPANSHGEQRPEAGLSHFLSPAKIHHPKCGIQKTQPVYIGGRCLLKRGSSPPEHPTWTAYWPAEFVVNPQGPGEYAIRSRCAG